MAGESTKSIRILRLLTKLKPCFLIITMVIVKLNILMNKRKKIPKPEVFLQRARLVSMSVEQLTNLKVV